MQTLKKMVIRLVSQYFNQRRILHERVVSYKLVDQEDEKQLYSFLVQRFEIELDFKSALLTQA